MNHFSTPPEYRNWSLNTIAQQGNLFRRRLTVVSAEEAPLNINDSQIESGFIAVITRIAVENETSDYTRLRIGVVEGNIFHPHEEEQNPNEDTLYWTSEEFYLSEGENLRIELTGTTSADRINVYIEGYRARVKS